MNTRSYNVYKKIRNENCFFFALYTFCMVENINIYITVDVEKKMEWIEFEKQRKNSLLYFSYANIFFLPSSIPCIQYDGILF